MALLPDDIAIPVRTEHLCDFLITFDHHELHTTPLGTRLTMIVGGGRCEGPG